MATRSSWLIKRMTAFAAVVAATTAFAADFPVKSVRIITPFPPGGSVDLVARLLAVDLGKAWGQQVIVDNRAGASGNIGTALAKNAVPDGYTLVVKLAESGCPATNSRPGMCSRRLLPHRAP